LPGQSTHLGVIEEEQLGKKNSGTDLINSFEGIKNCPDTHDGHGSQTPSDPIISP
jgi:hypothetical protein